MRAIATFGTVEAATPKNYDDTQGEKYAVLYQLNRA